MPKVSWMIPEEEKRIAEELRKRYGIGTLSIPQVQEELGLSRNGALAWLKDVPALRIESRKKYRVSDIAHKMYLCMEF